MIKAGIQNGKDDNISLKLNSTEDPSKTQSLNESNITEQLKKTTCKKGISPKLVRKFSHSTQDKHNNLLEILLKHKTIFQVKQGK